MQRRFDGLAQGWRSLGRNLFLPWLAFTFMGSAGCVCHAPVQPAMGPAHVLVARRGWHIDVGFDAADLVGPLAFIKAQFPHARYVFFGFGDERYVRSRSHHIPALAAAVWPGGGVMLVTAIENPPGEAFGPDHVAAIAITAGQLSALQQFLGNTFKPASADAPLQAGPYADSRFYLASARYSGLHTCNTWAAEALGSAGLPVHSHGVLFASQLWRQLRPLGASGRERD